MKIFKYTSGRYFRVWSVFLLLALIGGCNGTIRQEKATSLLSPDVSAGAFYPRPPYLPERIILNLTETPWSSQAVTWRTVSDEVSDPQAQIARVTESSDFIVTARTFPADMETVVVGKNNKRVYHHSAVFTSLSPDTLYAYRVGDGKHWSEWNQFKTAHKTQSPFKFVYFGDPQEQVRSMCSRVFRTAYKTAPDAAFWHFIGDLVDNGDNDEEWAELFEAFGWIPRMTPMILLPGNHEYPDKRYVHGKDFKLFHLWRPHFTLPENGPAGLEETVYFIDYQGVRFVMLNGNEQLEKQVLWLDGILSENPQRWTIVGIHQPVYSTGKKRKNKENSPVKNLFVPVFDKYSVDLVLQGHDHTYSRTGKLKNGIRVSDTEKGTVYIISVCGPKSYPVNDRYKDIMDKSGTDRQLFQVISIDENHLAYASYDASGEVYDSFVLKK
ncbi:MAG: metallophosphoesterase family protein [Desulfobacterales bacterium]|nr:metallophosphoesterase family protein [Desulfobacterales bacterium]MDD4072367.1 metallophosphoesterase family protein [Desulfobacterales bacterium]MDD4393039.1 metallophosphoesterase family protein [Desulfobacterales bacterium]